MIQVRLDMVPTPTQIATLGSDCANYKRTQAVDLIALLQDNGASGVPPMAVITWYSEICDGIWVSRLPDHCLRILNDLD